MISIDINMQMWLDYTSIKNNGNDKQNAEKAFKELFDDIFGTMEEYIKTDVEINDIRVVNESITHD